MGSDEGRSAAFIKMPMKADQVATSSGKDIDEIVNEELESGAQDDEVFENPDGTYRPPTSRDDSPPWVHDFMQSLDEDDGSAAKATWDRGLPIATARDDTPPGYVIRERPDGREELVTVDDYLDGILPERRLGLLKR